MNVVEEVIKDLRQREQVGLKKYGEKLRTFNGRNATQDAYEEALDLSNYLKQKLLEEESKKEKIISVFEKAKASSAYVFSIGGMDEELFNIILEEIKNDIIQIET